MTRFRRLVLELGHGGADPETMRRAALFARLLDAELHALFVEDETLLHASELPFAREISPLSYRWRPLLPDRLRVELRAAAEQARRRFEAAALSIGVERSFEIRRGDVALLIAETCVAGDIIVVSPPRGMGTGTTHGFLRMRESARRSAVSELFLPPRVSRAHGLIVAVTSGAADPALAVARQVATAGNERLLILAPAGSDVASDAAVRFFNGDTAQDVAAALADTTESLIVMTRNDQTHNDQTHGANEATDLGPLLAAARGVPVLVVVETE
jgi:hypothetical protein